MSWTTPRTWTSGEVVTDTILNTHIRDDLKETWHEVAYVEFTSPVTANSVIETNPQFVVTSGTVTYSAVPTLIEFFCPGLALGGSSNTHGLSLWDSGSDLGRLLDGTIVSSAAGVYPAFFTRRLTPSAASHVYRIGIWSNSATNFIAEAGAGGASTKLPGYIRVLQRGDA